MCACVCAYVCVSVCVYVCVCVVHISGISIKTCAIMDIRTGLLNSSQVIQYMYMYIHVYISHCMYTILIFTTCTC